MVDAWYLLAWFFTSFFGWLIACAIQQRYERWTGQREQELIERIIKVMEENKNGL